MRFRWIVLYASLLHVTWAVSLLLSNGSSMKTTALAGLLDSVPRGWLIACFVLVALLAITALRITEARESALIDVRVGPSWFSVDPRFLKILLIVPQQFVLMLSAGSAIEAMIRGEFADGVGRPHLFVIADQAPAVIAAICHTGAIVEATFARRL